MSGPAEPLEQRLYALLSDRGFHSGTSLARACGVSRSAVWRSLSGLRTKGLNVLAEPRRGYRLPDATAPLDAAQIRARLPREAHERLRLGMTVWSTGSTNADLLARADLPRGKFDFLIAEYQSAGRGRRARSWITPPAGAICLSLSWCFAAPPSAIGALGLAVGVCALRALERRGIGGVRLKWPNDLFADGRKLGGILAELRAQSSGAAFVVIGLGINVALGSRTLDRVRDSGTSATDLAALGVMRADRNELAAELIAAIIAGLRIFECTGLESFTEQWRRLDDLAGRAVQVRLDSSIVNGLACGIDADGALRVQTEDGIRRFTAGDVSVRAVA